MDDNEKLLEAAKTIKKHCNESCTGKPCPFSKISENRCAGSDWCHLSGKVREWKILNFHKWTPADKALAAGLKANGYTSITRVFGSGHVIVSLKESPDSLDLGKDLFADLCRNEVVNLDEIIGEV